MTKRIRVTDTTDPQTKVFAITKRFEQFSEGSLKRTDGEWKFYARTRAYPDSLPKLDALFEKLLSLDEVSVVSIDGDSQISVTLGPAFFWSDLNDGISVLDHVVRFIIDCRFAGAEDVEVAFDTPSYIDVFPSSYISKVFVCTAQIATAEGEFYYWRQTDGGITNPSTKDANAKSLAYALLLHKHIIWVRITGKQVAVGAGHRAKDGEQTVQQEYPLEGDLLDYVVSTIRNNVFSGAYVPARMHAAKK